MDLEYQAMVISGQPGAGASTTSKKVKKRLKEEYGIEWKIGHFSDIWEKKKKHEGYGDLDIDEYWDNHVSLADNQEADERMRDKIVRGEVHINDGRYIQPYLGLEGGEDRLGTDDILKVRLVADLDSRADRVKGRDGYQNVDGKNKREKNLIRQKKLLNRQLDEVNKGAINYDKTHTNEEHYDLVIDNTPREKDADTVAEEIVEKIVGL